MSNEDMTNIINGMEIINVNAGENVIVQGKKF